MKLRPFDHREGVSVVGEVTRKGDVLEFGYLIEGDTIGVFIPPPSSPVRTDGLWESTCFEAFIGTGATSYIELNFAPSGEWAAYSFAAYRQGMRELDIAPPAIGFENNRLIATASLAAEPGSPLSLTAVIKLKSGVRGYWALAHPEGDRPDFHARDCFVAKLP
ncbi:MAG TPA: DOMON-like domain-containing protein [Sphingomicrobium sp.]|jgi:hypothetical protein|nr:DOMON-like domain-containing protein [Sphingomicrobium sp.]